VICAHLARDLSAVVEKTLHSGIGIHCREAIEVAGAECAQHQALCS